MFSETHNGKKKKKNSNKQISISSMFIIQLIFIREEDHTPPNQKKLGQVC